MKNKITFCNILLAVVFLVGFTGLTRAQATRTWVSGVGDDANPCSRTAPCKTFAGAISKTAALGEINIIDPGGFGGVTITKSITIDGSPFLAGVLVSGTNAIIINAPSNSLVTLRGLDINGLGTGLNGIRIISAGVVNIENCTIYGFTNMGISDERTTGGKLFVTNTIIKNNTQSNIGITGISTPAIAANIDNVKLLNSANENGLLVSGGNTAAISNSVISGNFLNGILANDANTDVSAENCVLTNNSVAIRIQASSSIIRISGNTITKNGTSLRPGSGGGQIISYGNNKISGNTVELAPTMTVSQQ